MARILVVDDDEQVRKMLMLTLLRAGHQVLGAIHGDQALEICRREPIELVITDIVMPEKEGIETIMLLKKQHPDMAIIAISGGGQIAPTEYLMLAEQLGARRTFSKPVPRRALLQAIQELVPPESESP